MSSTDVRTRVSARHARDAVGPEQAEAALVEHYPRLVRLAYLVLPSSLGRHRRVLTAHAVAQRSLPRGRRPATPPALPAPRHGGDPAADPGYACLRLRVLRTALDTARPPRLAGRELRWLPRLPRALPQVLGLRVFPRPGGADELALEQALSALHPAARAAYVLRRLEGLSDIGARELLLAADVSEERVRSALRAADGVPEPAGSRDETLLWSQEFNPCALHARPTDLLRRRQHGKAAGAAAAALAVVVGLLLFLPGGWDRSGPAAPPYAGNAAAEAALDPAQVVRVPQDAWRDAARLDFSVWPARGSAVEDEALLGRALTVWARPGDHVAVSATPGTPTGPAAGPPHLLFAGEVEDVAYVVLHDGHRLVRYAEAAGQADGGAVLDFARADASEPADALAVLVHRSPDSARYLTAPWATDTAHADLLDPAVEPVDVPVADDGLTADVPSPAQQDDCAAYPVLRTATAGGPPHVLADLGELTPARITFGPPEEADRSSAPALDDAAAERWARTACQLPVAAGNGVRTVNAWEFASQQLPDGEGTGRWLCTRAETWRGAGGRALTQFQAPLPDGTAPADAPGTVTGGAADTAACGARAAGVLSQLPWRSAAGDWYLLAAGSDQVTGVRADGAVSDAADGRTWALPVADEDTAAGTDVVGELADGEELTVLR